jgi:hypothetical protein
MKLFSTKKILKNVLRIKSKHINHYFCFLFFFKINFRFFDKKLRRQSIAFFINNSYFLKILYVKTSHCNEEIKYQALEKFFCPLNETIGNI